ncbi:MAG: DUF4175 family protein [Chitinivibrionales bacterium]
MQSDKNRIIQFLNRHRAWFVAVSVVNFIASVSLVLFLLLAALSAGFGIFPWTALPVLFDAILVVGAIVAIFSFFHKVIFRKPSLKQIAAMVEARAQRPHQSLVVGYELSTENPDGSAALISSAIRQAAESLPLYPKRLPGLLKFRRLAATGLAALVCALLLSVVKPSILSYWDIPLYMFRQVEARISPGSKTLPAHTTVEFSCIPNVSRYPSARLTLVELETGYKQTRLLRPGPDGDFKYVIDSIAKSYAYSFSLGSKALGEDTLTVVNPPTLYSLRVKLTPPWYTGRKPVELQEGQGSFTAYAGTRADITLASHHSLADAVLKTDWGDTIRLSIDSGSAQGEMDLWRGGDYSFALEDSLGQRADSLPRYAVDIIPDNAPDVRIIKPGRNKALTTAQVESLWVECIDDIGIGELSLHWRRSGTGDAGKKTLVENRRETIIQKEVVWNLTELSLYPGDTIYYWAHVIDNRPWKPHTAVSDTFWFRVPSFSEIHKQVAQKEGRTEQALESVKKGQQQMQDKLEQLIKSAKGKESLSWEEKKIIEDVGKNMQAQVDSLNKSVENMQQTIEDMKEQGVLTEDLAEKIEKVRESVKDLVDQYGDSLLFEPPDPNDDISWKEMQESVEKMSEMLPELQENLDNTLQYLEMLKKDMELARLSARSEQLAGEQSRMTEQDSSDQARSRQESLNEDISNLLEDIKKMSDSSAQQSSSLNEASKSLQQMQKEMNSSPMPSNSSMARMSGALQSMSQELNSMMSTAMMAQMLEDRDRLISLAGDALDLADWQSMVEQGSQRSSQQKMTAAQQQALKDALTAMTQSVDSLGATPPQMLQPILQQMQQAQRQMQQALQSMASGRSSSHMQNSTGSLNSLANTLMASANAMQQQMQGSGSGGASGGLMPSMRKLSGKQATINSATGEMMRQMLQGSQKPGSQGGQKPGGGTQASEQARKEAQQAQKELADQLNELAQKYGKERGGEAGERLRELEKEARRLAKMLENPSADLRDRQENFLVRMLQSTLSMHKQGEGKEKRKSTQSKEAFSSRTIETEQGTGFDDVDQFYRLRNRAMQSNFPESYRPTVQAYFDSLGVLYLRD